MSPSDSSSTTATTDPLSVLALLEDEQKFKLGGVLTVVISRYLPSITNQMKLFKPPDLPS
ncbi:hypothetical protein U9M48_039409 [Paspalum notatum var. saurae]|uniref:Uncharacterized protein n=1 Tax=Paspalum notatum var. saurae TaxID=547442 RepID=A0AAQ3XD60_PASNO